jgi:hypothetical protein
MTETYNVVQYQVGVQGLSTWTKPSDLSVAIENITKRASEVGRPYRIAEKGDDFGPKRTIPEVKTVLSKKAEAGEVGDKWLLSAGDAAKTFVLRKVTTKLKLIDTVGTNQVDLIYSAVTAKFQNVISWGICNCRSIAGSSSWSQHAWCHAWDIHATPAVMQAVFDFLVKEAKAKRLPVAHAIYNRKIWTPSEGLHGYGGSNPHTDHVHVDASPNFSGTPPCAR